MSHSQPMPVSAETINALVDALGALVFATVRALPAEQRAGFADSLAAAARAMEMQGHSASETLLIDLHRAATSAAT